MGVLFSAASVHTLWKTWCACFSLRDAECTNRKQCEAQREQNFLTPPPFKPLISFMCGCVWVNIYVHACIYVCRECVWNMCASLGMCMCFWLWYVFVGICLGGFRCVFVNVPCLHESLCLHKLQVDMNELAICQKHSLLPSSCLTPHLPWTIWRIAELRFVQSQITLSPLPSHCPAIT